jgi:hypothetical protein
MVRQFDHQGLARVETFIRAVAQKS